MTSIDRIRAMLAAASTADADVRVAYVAGARAQLDVLRHEVETLETMVAAIERELVRASGGTA